jgi:hypothetical protein
MVGLVSTCAGADTAERDAVQPSIIHVQKDQKKGLISSAEATDTVVDTSEIQILLCAPGCNFSLTLYPQSCMSLTISY